MPLTCHTLHPEAIAWAKAATTNGGTFTTRTLRAVSTFAADVDRAGIRDRFLRLNLVCGTNLAAARTPLYRGESRTATQYGNAADVNNGPFVSGDYSEANGIAGDGNSKYFDTTLTIGTLKTFGASYENVHVSVYKRSSANDYGGPDFGGGDYSYAQYEGNTCLLDTTKVIDGASQVFDAGGDGWGYHAVMAQYFGNGLHLAQMYPSTTAGAYLRYDSAGGGGSDNISVSGSPKDFVNTDGTPLLFCGVWSNYDTGSGIVDNPSYGSNTLSAYSVGKAFATSGQRTAFSDAMQRFQTALGRAV